MKITTTEQFTALVAELEKNPALAKGFNRGNTPVDFKEQWDAIANKVNAFGPPIRNGDGWQKVWRDLKFKTKKKVVHNTVKARAEGGGIYKQKPLNLVEEAVANLLQFEKKLNHEVIAIDQQEEIRTEEPPTDSNFDISITSEDSFTDDQPSVSHAAQADHRKRKHDKCSDCNCGFEKHQMMLENISTLVVAIKDGIKEISRYHRKMYELESKKLKLMEREEEREEQLYKTNMEFKKVKIGYAGPLCHVRA